jgi:molybdopterin-containing oxidoreductase family iron-sulfur binding subunit
MPSVGTLGDAGYWRSLADLAGDPELKAREGHEFHPDALEPPDPVTRRRFMQLMGASVAMAGVVGCTRDTDKIVPYSHAVPGQTPGIPRFYATSMDLGGVAQALIVKSYDGRPIKVEGNPQHPASLGGTGVFALGSVLGLYDPDRSRRLVKFENGQETKVEPKAEAPKEGEAAGKHDPSWEDFQEFTGPHFSALQKTGGAGLAVLSEASSSPSLRAVRETWAKTYPQAKWYEYEPISFDNEREGARLAFGKPYRPLYDLGNAEIIVCLDADLLGSHPNAVQYTRQFADGRNPDAGHSNRLYAVESVVSLTGGMADHRLPIKSSEVATFAKALAAALKKGNETKDAKVATIEVPGGEYGKKFFDALVKDLNDHKGKAIIAVGPRQPTAIHELIHRLNDELGNNGTKEGADKPCVLFADVPDADRPTHLQAIKDLAAELGAGKVKTLVILGGNPVYNASADLNFAELLKKVETSIHLSSHLDETSRLCKWHLPRAHYLESWGDALTYNGTYSLVQPLIEPLHGGRSDLDVLSLLLGEAAATGSATIPGVGPIELPLSAYSIVRQTFRKKSGEKDFETRWRQAVHDGFVKDWAFTSTSKPELKAIEAPKDDAPKADATPPKEGSATPAVAAKDNKPTDTGLEVVFIGDTRLYDGRFANNAWLQETPDPISKITWDNVAYFSPATAAARGIDNATKVRLRCRGRDIEVAACVLPGQANDSVTVILGGGRTEGGTIAGSVTGNIPTVGFNTYNIRTSAQPDVDDGLVVEALKTVYRLAVTQDLWTIDPLGVQERERRLSSLIREDTLAHFSKAKAKPVHSLPMVPKTDVIGGGQLFDGPPAFPDRPGVSPDHRWAMTIDLTKCTGCNACIVACVSENNIPVVGKDQVLRSRHMHWIRLDRYYRGSTENPEIIHQPVPCMQCENAPCEQVCPVAATMHDAEGLNAMAYNRCIGTRYCSNNCPYKVRRFNFFWNHARVDNPNNEVLKMAFNPEVTVRGRGVMEKCTYCVQRINAVKIRAKNAEVQYGKFENSEAKKGPTIKDEELVKLTACAQACPAQAITFGDLNNAESQVSKLQAGKRAYSMLEELNIRPRTQYLTRVRNLHPDLSDSKTEAAHEHSHS